MKVLSGMVRGFIEAGDPATEAAKKAILAKIGDNEVKKGWSAEREAICLAIYAEHKAPIYKKIDGELVDVSQATTSDGRGNTYHKVRLTMRNSSGDRVIVSLDRDTEFTQRLLCKLIVVEPGTPVTLAMFVEPVERNGRQFVNYIPTLKVSGKEVAAAPGHFAAAAEKGKAAEAALKSAGLGNNKELVNKARQGAKIEYFAELADQVQAKFTSRTGQEEQGGAEGPGAEDW